MLDEEGYWDGARKHTAVRLLGHRPEDVFDDPSVAWIFGACYAIAPDPKIFWSGCYRATPIHPDNREDRARVAELERRLPDPVEAMKQLRSLVRREMARLRQRQTDVLNARSNADRQGAFDRGMLDDASSMALFLRYQTAASRDLSRSLTELSKLRKESSREAPREEARPDSPVPPAARRNEAKPRPDRGRKASPKSASKSLSDILLGRSMVSDDPRLSKALKSVIATPQAGAVMPFSMTSAM